jgi:hypothetical protein
MIKLVNVYESGRIRPGAIEFLYGLVKERLEEPDTNISHRTMPTIEQHRAFMHRRPYTHWYLVETELRRADIESATELPPLPTWVGYISATPRNEIGIVLLKYWRGRGLGPAIVQEFIKTHDPLPAEPSVRSGSWLANIHPKNSASLHMFQSKLGGKIIQVTMELEPRPAPEAKP